MGNGQSGYALATGSGQEDDGGFTPKDPPAPVFYYNPEQRLQRVQDTYDGTLQQSRFQFQSPIHF